MTFVEQQPCYHASSQNYENTLLASSRLSVRMEQFGSHWTDFDETSYLSFFRKSVEKILNVNKFRQE